MEASELRARIIEPRATALARNVPAARCGLLAVEGMAGLDLLTPSVATAPLAAGRCWMRVN